MSNANTSSAIPIGTIVPFAGLVDVAWLKQQGWLYCDGSLLDKVEYAALFSAISNNYGVGSTGFNLPDLRGYFIRGVDHASGHDPEANTRMASSPGGLNGDNPGSFQRTATGRPVASFTAAKLGSHVHAIPHVPTGGNAYALAGSHYGIWTTIITFTDPSGEHTHTIDTGGDKETRPVNAYVNFIIKFKNGTA